MEETRRNTATRWPSRARTSNSVQGVGSSSRSGGTAATTRQAVSTAEKKAGRGSASRRAGGGVVVVMTSLCRAKWPSTGHFLGHSDAVRADRLIAVLLLLQTRARVTVGEVARELEVSAR